MNIGSLIADILATDQRQLRVGPLLRRIAEGVDAVAAVIWTAEGPTGANTAAMNVFAYAARGAACVIHDMPWNRSAIGRSVREQRVLELRKDEFRNEHPGHVSFLDALGACSFCAVPFAFADGTAGALTVYRNATNVPKRLQRKIASVAAVLPGLLRIAEDRASVEATTALGEIFRGIEQQTRAPSVGEIDTALLRVCKVLNETFDCFETSIFIADSTADPDMFRLAATTFEDVAKSRTYDRKDTSSLTSWVIRNARPILLYDLESWSADSRKIRRRYPGLRWSKLSARRTDLRKLLGIGPEQTKPPHAFMATPLVHRQRVFGVIRCSISREQRFFSHRDLMLLTLFANQIGTTLQNWLSMRESEDENVSWRMLVESVSRLNSFVDAELSKDVPDEHRIFDEALSIAGHVLRCASINDVRMIALSPERALKFVAISGPGWNEPHASGVRRKDRLFPLDVDSAGSYVFKQRTVHVVADAVNADHYSGTFPNATGLIAAPIETEATVFGVLDLRKTSAGPFPPHASAIAELLARQLGLYHRLVSLVGRLKASEREQRDTYEDLAHQMRTPTSQALQRAKAALAAAPVAAGSQLERHLHAIRGLCRKAHRVALSTGFFSELARETDVVTINVEELTQTDMTVTAIEAAADISILVEPSWNLQFKVDRSSFEILANMVVRCDKALMEQVLNCFLDNAAKYSYRNTVVTISGGLTGRERDRFFVSVRNQGRRVRMAEVELVKQRHWRGEEARIVTAEGKGIGLWISDQILRAHGGSVIVTPTDDRHMTDVRMLFPIERRRRG